MGFAKDLSGQRFGRLTAIERVGSTRDRQALWKCLCDCGATVLAASGHLRTLHTKSCGCFNRDASLQRFTTHGMSYTATFNIWRGMLQRCNNTRNHAYSKYGGRGIGVCERWNVFENFLADMGKRPDGLSLDRINNDLGYSPDNCRWADRRTQALNKSTTIWITLDGITKCMTYWAREFSVQRQSILSRVKQGMSHKDALLAAKAAKRRTAPPGYAQGVEIMTNDEFLSDLLYCSHMGELPDKTIREACERFNLPYPPEKHNEQHAALAIGMHHRPVSSEANHRQAIQRQQPQAFLAD